MGISGESIVETIVEDKKIELTKDSLKIDLFFYSIALISIIFFKWYIFGSALIIFLFAMSLGKDIKVSNYNYIYPDRQIK